MIVIPWDQTAQHVRSMEVSARASLVSKDATAVGVNQAFTILRRLAVHVSILRKINGNVLSKVTVLLD